MCVAAASALAGIIQDSELTAENGIPSIIKDSSLQWWLKRSCMQLKESVSGMLTGDIGHEDNLI